MIQIPDQIVKWLPSITEEELKMYMVINRYITEEEPIPLEKFFDATGIGHPHKVNRSMASLIDKGIISFKVSLNGQGPKPVRWWDTSSLEGAQTRKINDIGRRAIKEIQDKPRASHGYFIEDLLTGSQSEVFLAFYEQKNKEEKIKRKKRTKKKKNKKEKNKKKYDCILYIEIKDNKDIKINFPYGKLRQNPEKSYNPPDLKKTKFFIASFLTSSNNSSSKTYSKEKYQGLLNFLELARKKIQSRQANQLVSYMSEKLYSVSSGEVKLTSQWATRQKSTAKRLLREYPSMPFDEWLEAMDFFFNDDFWCDKIINFLSLEKHLNRYQLAKNRKKSSSKKLKSRLSKSKVIE